MSLDYTVRISSMILRLAYFASTFRASARISRRLAIPAARGGVWGFAAYGEKRLNWALERFEEKIRFAEARARNPANRVRSVRVAVFGFSRGAALARAFCRELQARCMPKGSGFVLKGRDYPVEISFLGIFDTVASVGVPLSVNRYGNHAGRMLKPLAFSMGDKPELYTLAFGAPGADPAPGTADGHGGWAEDLAIVPMVRQCLHLVAAHELRNSFPLDSVLAERHYPPGVAEIVYPGAHSDVGGGYRDGEGARSNLLAMIPLRVMHARACEAGVPLVPLTRLDDGEADFAVDAAGSRAFAELEGYFNHYMQAAGWSGGDLGARVLAHRALFYRWRFYQIARDRARNTPTAEQRRMRDNTQRFSREQAALERSVSEKKAALERAQRNHTAAEQARRQDQNLYYRAGKPIDPAVAAREHDARSRLDAARDAYLREKAKLDTAASDAGLEAALKKFDRQLMEDAAAIRQWRDDNPKLALRPHYRILLQAYEDEFVHGRGLRDAKIIHFFDHYVHDSLVAFDKDLTRCSDPRVIYIGGDRKLRYAGTGALAAHG